MHIESKIKLFFLLASLCLLLILACKNLNEFSNRSITKQIDTAPEFNIIFYDSYKNSFKSSIHEFISSQNKPTILNFWASDCFPCRIEMKELQLFFEQKKMDALIIGIDVGSQSSLGTKNGAKDLIKEFNLTYPLGYSEKKDLLENYGIIAIPSTVWILPNKKLYLKWTGILNKDTLSKITTEMIKNMNN